MIDYQITMMVPIAVGMKQRPQKRPAFLPALKLAIGQKQNFQLPQAFGY